MVEVSALPHVDAKSVAEMLAPEKTALIVVDIQTDFAAPFGLLGGYGVDLSTVERAIDRIEELIAAARVAGAVVAFMRVVTRPDTDTDAMKTLMVRRGSPGGESICRAEGRGADYYRVSPQPGDIQIEKLMFDGFHGTNLDAQLRARGIDTVVMTGVSTDCCVDSSARTAFHNGYNVFVVSDACAAYEPELHAGTLNVLQKNLALLLTTQSVVEAWS